MAVLQDVSERASTRVCTGKRRGHSCLLTSNQMKLHLIEWYLLMLIIAKWLCAVRDTGSCQACENFPSIAVLCCPRVASRSQRLVAGTHQSPTVMCVPSVRAAVSQACYLSLIHISEPTRPY